VTGKGKKKHPGYAFCKFSMSVVRADYPERHPCAEYKPVMGYVKSCLDCVKGAMTGRDGKPTEWQQEMINEYRYGKSLPAAMQGSADV